MADGSYSELLTAAVELNLSDFREKLKAADVVVDSMARGSKRSRRGESFQMAGDDLILAAVKELKVFSQKVMMDSIHECPDDTGVLWRSGRVQTPKKTGKRVKVEMGYGYGDEVNPKTRRVAAQYAWPVHEIYDAEHEPPTKDHFLIDPLLDHARTFQADLAVAMRNATAGTFEKYRVHRGYTELDLGEAIKTKVPAIGGGSAFRGGNPSNPGQFTKRPK